MDYSALGYTVQARDSAGVHVGVAGAGCFRDLLTKSGVFSGFDTLRPAHSGTFQPLTPPFMTKTVLDPSVKKCAIRIGPRCPKLRLFWTH